MERKVVIKYNMMKKTLSIIIALAIFISVQPVVAQTEIEEQIVNVFTNELIDNGNDILTAKFRFGIANYSATSTIKIPADGFKMSLTGKNYSDSAAGTVIQILGKIKNVNGEYQLAPGEQGIVTTEAKFSKEYIYTGAYTASLDGIYLSSGGVEKFIEPDVINTTPIEVVGGLGEVEKTQYELNGTRVVQVDGPEGAESIAVVEVIATIHGGEKGLTFKKEKGISIETGDGKRGVVVISKISDNAVEDDFYYTVPAEQSINITLLGVFKLADLPHGDFSLTLIIPEDNIPLEVEDNNEIPIIGDIVDGFKSFTSKFLSLFKS